MSQDGHQSQIHQAVKYLAAHCDGAITRDDQGFNGFDAPRGRALASQPALTMTDEAGALRMLQKYRGQLSTGGYDYDRLLADFAATANTHTLRNGNGNGSTPAPSDRTIERDGDVFVLRFPFQQDSPIRSAVKRIPGYRWNTPEHPKCWTLPVARAAHVQQLAAQFDFQMLGDAASAAAEPAVGPVTAAPPPPVGRSVSVDGDVFVINAPYELLKERRQLPGRRWDRDRLVDIVPVQSAAYVREFARQYRFACSSAADELFAAAPSLEEVVRAERWIDVIDDSFGQHFVVHNEYNEELIDAMRRIPNRRYDPHTSLSEIPAAQCLEVEEYGQRFGFTFTPAAQRIIDEHREASRLEQERIAGLVDASKSKAPSPEFAAEIAAAGLEGLFAYQAAAVEYLLDHADGRSFEGSDMGTGKTVTSLAAAELLYRRTDGEAGYPLLITCPKSLILNWQKEARRWHRQWGVQRSIEIIRSNSSAGLFGRADITIINHEIMGRRIEVLTGGYKGMINDESHCYKEKRAQRTKIASWVASEIGGPKPLILNLTGTAFVNGRPAELIPQLQILRRLDDFGGYHAFYKRFCGDNAKASQNLNELGVELRTRCFRRVLKGDVLDQLPARIVSRVEVDIDNEPEYRYAEAQFLKWLQEFAGAEAAARAARAEMLVRMNYLRKLVAKGKLSAAIEWARNNLDAGNKLVLFAHHKEVQDQVARALGEYNPRTIQAGQSTEERERNVEEFQEDQRVQVMVASLMSGSVGLTLTASSNPALLELPWTPKDYNQAIDRTHRIGQHDSVTAWPIVCPGTIDDYMEEILAEKGAVAAAALDGTAAGDEEQSVMVEVARRMLRNA